MNTDEYEALKVGDTFTMNTDDARTESVRQQDVIDWRFIRVYLSNAAKWNIEIYGMDYEGYCIDYTGLDGEGNWVYSERNPDHAFGLAFTDEENEAISKGEHIYRFMTKEDAIIIAKTWHHGEGRESILSDPSGLPVILDRGQYAWEVIYTGGEEE